MKRQIITLLCLVASVLFPSDTKAGSRGLKPGDPSRYNIVWESPSKDHSGSMPLGNGDVSVNAWVEPSGDLVMYIGKSDSWDENSRLLKVGKVRLRVFPAPTGIRGVFRQELSLVDATIRVGMGRGKDRVDLRVWVDANRPVVYAKVESSRPVRPVVSIELWRTTQDTLRVLEASDVYCDYNSAYRGTTYLEPDSILTGPGERIGWFHHNIRSVGPAITSRIQGLDGFPRQDPLIGRTFGAVVTAVTPERVDSLHLASSRGTRHFFSISVLTRQPSTPGSWLRAIDSVAGEASQIPFAVGRAGHEGWWKEFWDRSWINVESAGGGSSDTTDDAFVVSRAYALQRFMNACAGRGRYPIKFNGSTFTVPAAGQQGDADYRRWGPAYWWQNTRLPYIGMCASGDFDLIQPLFTMYGRELMPLFRYRTQLYMGHGGAFIPECIYFWGDVFNETYGWTPFEKRSDKLQDSRYHKWEWVSGLELVSLMLEYYGYTGDEAFLRSVALPCAREVLTFFNEQYPMDSLGRMVMRPAQALETWWECTNAMPEVAGLHAVTTSLLELPERLVTGSDRQLWKTLEGKLPDLPTCVVGGAEMLAPAASFADKQNSETPELYAVYPFRQVALEKSNKDLGIAALEARVDRGNEGWRQDEIFMAYLGLADSARQYIVGRARAHDPGSRFPAFWGPNYDWVPDQDHGSVLLKALQSMLLQNDRSHGILLPAWPRGWNAEFKLRAPLNTTVTGRVADGKIVDLEVFPKARMVDFTVWTGE